MLTSVFGISMKYEAWNHQDSLPVYIAGSYEAHLSKPLDFEELFRTIKRYGGAGAS